jgi:hypothetical protein
LVGGEVLFDHEPLVSGGHRVLPAVLHVGRDELCDLAFVERLGSLLGDELERVGLILLDEDRTCWIGTFATDKIDLARGREQPDPVAISSHRGG